jgi:hypothetical protein
MAAVSAATKVAKPRRYRSRRARERPRRAGSAGIAGRKSDDIGLFLAQAAAGLPRRGYSAWEAANMQAISMMKPTDSQRSSVGMTEIMD